MECLALQGIPYVWCWAGYRIHGKEVCGVDAAYCPIDIYIQKSIDRHWDEEEYDHWIAVDIVAPCMAHASLDMRYYGRRPLPGYYS